jgi:tetratricopeptide (TPR) repeat protein
VAVLGFVLVTGLLAQQEKLWGIRDERSGHTGSALHHLRTALRLNPLLGLDPDLELALGQCDIDRGLISTPLANYAAVIGPQSSRLPAWQRSDHLNQAMAADPRNAVIAAAAVEELAGSVNTVSLANGPAVANSVLVAYTTGRAAFEQGNYTAAIEAMRAAMSRSNNADIVSSSLTYIALSEQQQHDDVAFRRDIRRAVKADRADQNQLARETAAGLFLTGES